ncbi:hypothetical protein CYMTET_3814, partial [Cymbomonas tetramitiformis]
GKHFTWIRLQEMRPSTRPPAEDEYGRQQRPHLNLSLRPRTTRAKDGMAPADVALPKRPMSAHRRHPVAPDKQHRVLSARVNSRAAAADHEDVLDKPDENLLSVSVAEYLEKPPLSKNETCSIPSTIVKKPAVLVPRLALHINNSLNSNLENIQHTQSPRSISRDFPPSFKSQRSARQATASNQRATPRPKSAREQRAAPRPKSALRTPPHPSLPGPHITPTYPDTLPKKARSRNPCLAAPSMSPDESRAQRPPVVYLKTEAPRPLSGVAGIGVSPAQGIAVHHELRRTCARH